MCMYVCINVLYVCIYAICMHVLYVWWHDKLRVESYNRFSDFVLILQKPS